MAERKLVEKFKFADRYFSDAMKYFEEENYKKAEKELKKCLETMPEHANAQYLLAQIEYKKGNFEKALENIEKAKTNYKFIAQFFTFTHQERLEALRDQKSTLEERIRYLQTQLSSLSGVSGSSAQQQRGRLNTEIQTAKNEISKIDTHLNEPVPPSLEIPADYYYQHGNIFFRLKKFQDAHEQWLRTIEENPEHGSAYNNLANLFYMAKQYENALKYLEQAETHGARINPEFKKAILKALEKK